MNQLQKFPFFTLGYIHAIENINPRLRSIIQTIPDESAVPPIIILQRYHELSNKETGKDISPVLNELLSDESIDCMDPTTLPAGEYAYCQK
jgi:hypothetical protein